MQTALITGIAGQDGSYLAEQLLEQGFRVVGVSRPNDTHLERIEHLKERLILEPVNLLSDVSLEEFLLKYKPNEIYNLGGESFMPAFAQAPLQTTEPNAMGPMRLLEAVRKFSPQSRFFQASSSEMFGHAKEQPQSEQTPFSPLNLYAVAKVFAHSTSAYYRRQYNLFTCSGILFNHESPRRKPNFVTRKITSTAARIKLGLATELQLGNLETRRDWGFAGDYVRAMTLMLRHHTPDDYVIATGETHSVREFCDLAFSHLGLDYRKYVVQNPQFMRSEDYQPVGNPEKARQVLGWQPTVKFPELVGMMVEADLKLLNGRAK